MKDSREEPGVNFEEKPLRASRLATKAPHMHRQEVYAQREEKLACADQA